MATFAAGLTAEGCRASASQVSRWESGRMAVPYRAVVAYERALELPPNSLVAVVDAQLRHATTHLAPSRLDRGVDPDGRGIRSRAEDLLDRATSNGLMTGSDWDELTVLVTALDNVLMPTSMWETLVGRLLSEQLVADGIAWRQRSEATHRLLWLPRSRPHVIGACAALIRDPLCQVVIEPLAILDVADEPDVAALLMAQLVDAKNERALRGALLASINKVRHQQFNPPQLRRVTAAVTDLLADPRLHTAVRPLAGELLGQLPVALRDQAMKRLQRAFASDPGLTDLVSSRRTANPDRSRHIVDRVTAWVVSRVPNYVDTAPDEVLARLVDEMLFSTNLDVRLHAAQLVGATPFRSPLADAFCAELVKPAVARDAVSSSAILEALPFVASSCHRPTAEVMILANGLPGLGASTAAWSIGHLPGDSDDRFWSAALARHGLAWRQHRSLEASSALRGLVYALGISGQAPKLAAIRMDRTLPPDVREAAHWWSSLPTVITQSARH
jgi:hypothetical protein